MPVSYETWLVCSIVMAIQGTYVGLSLAVQIGEASGMRRRLLLAGAALSLAVATGPCICRHAGGAHAVLGRLSGVSDAAVVSGLRHRGGRGGLCHQFRAAGLLRLTLSACLMGGGIFTMHYIGMSALSASAYIVHDRYYVAASMAIAIATSGLALWLATGRGGRPPLILSAIAFGVAVPACTTPR